jgi:ATP-dependent DNA helicase RecQ
LSETHEILKRYWGYDAFRPLQEDIIASILSGKDTLAILPTGGGKSICFQVPALAREGICIVISPLIALMKDQVENLRKRDIC